MERTTPKPMITMSGKQFQTLTSMLVARAGLAARLGMQYGGDRDLYKALGYKTILDYVDFLAYYTRHDLANAIIDRPVKATWQGQLELVESQEPEKTPFEKAWADLNRKFKLRSLLSRVDRLTGIGRYGVLLLGLDDVSDQQGFVKPVRPGNRKLLYIKPFGEETAKIDTWEDDPSNERYAMPLIYNIQVVDAASGKSNTIRVHHTRVIHITDDNLESEVYGTPRLEAVFNRLMDADKVVGGSAEMFWRGARPGFGGEIDKDFTMTPESKATVDEQFDEYEAGLRRFLLLEGIKIKGLDQQISDPSKNLDVILTCISAKTGIPKRILSGSERGELSSGQDAMEWKIYVQSRREDHAEPHIIYPLVERLMTYGILPTVVEYTVDWLDLFSISEKDRVDIGQKRSESLRSYTTNPIAQAVVPTEAFFDLFLGLSTQQIDYMKKMVARGMSEDLKALMKELEDATPKPPIPEGRPIPGQKPLTRTTPVKKVA